MRNKENKMADRVTIDGVEYRRVADEKRVNLLKEYINRWKEKVVAAENLPSTGCRHCPLCGEWRGEGIVSCVGCPINDDGNRRCGNTPYEKYRDAKEAAINGAMREVLYLEKLLAREKRKV